MIRSGLISGSGLIFRLRLVSWLIFLSISRVLNIGDVSRISINTVGYSLGTTIGQQNVVFAGGSITVPVFALTKVQTSVIILNIVAVVVMGGLSFVGGFFVGGGVVRGGSVGGGVVGGGQSQES